MTDTDRNDDGTFKEGNKANPEGNNGRPKGWQRPGDRAVRLAEKFSSEEILEYGRDAQKRAKELSYWDGVTILHMARMIEPSLTRTDSGADHVNKEREAMYDRLDGKPAQTTILQNPNGTALMPTMAIMTPADGATAYQEALKRASEPSE